MEGIKTIQSYEDYVRALRTAGMTMFGSDEGIFSLNSYFGDKIEWHTECADTDPWQWRMRVLKETEDISYSKYFFRKGGLITKEWYPYFYAARRGRRLLEEEYYDGNISREAKMIYNLVNENRELPAHEIRSLGGFMKEDKTRLEGALVQLQMRMYLTVCGEMRKRNRKGEEYGWSSSVFCTAERFFGPEVIREAEQIPAEEAVGKLREHILLLNPQAQVQKVDRFILGS